MLRAKASKLGINMKKTVDKIVPRREIMKASEKRARFLLTTIKPAKYRTIARITRVIKKTTRGNIKLNSSGIRSRHATRLPNNRTCNRRASIVKPLNG